MTQVVAESLIERAMADVTKLNQGEWCEALFWQIVSTLVAVERRRAAVRHDETTHVGSVVER